MTLNADTVREALEYWLNREVMRETVPHVVTKAWVAPMERGFGQTEGRSMRRWWRLGTLSGRGSPPRRRLGRAPVDQLIVRVSVVEAAVATAEGARAALLAAAREVK